MGGEVATGTFLFPDGTLEELEAPVLGSPTGAVYVRLLVQDVADTHLRGSTFQPPAIQLQQTSQQVQPPRTQYVWMCLD